MMGIINRIARECGFRRFTRSLVVLCLVIPTYMFAGLPPEAERDRLLIQVKDAFVKEDYNAAITSLEEILTLKLPVDPLFHFFYGKSLFHVNRYSESLTELESYIKTAGKDSKNYSEALTIYNQSEAKAKEEAAAKIYSKALTMVRIEPGTFTMGSPDNEAERSDDEIQHVVTITQPFEIGKYEVSQALWIYVMGTNPSYFTECLECPVENVSWDDVQEFLKKINEAASGKDYRLPTEAEWEYACRAGTTGPFNTGSCLSTQDACYNGDHPLEGCGKGTSFEKTWPIGNGKANAWGIYNMHGNVWEWCSDWYEDYPSGSVTDPAGASSGSGRVVRGGNWNRDARDCRSADRVGGAPDYRFIHLGFRLARASGQ